MSLHVDTLFYKVSDTQINQQSLFTIIYRYDQNTADVAVIPDVILDQFRKDLPKVTTLYTNQTMLAAIMETPLLKQFTFLSDKNELSC